VEKALAKLSYARSHHGSRRTQLERELEDAQRKLDRLVDALADGSLPADEIKGRLGAEKARKTALQAELTKLERLGGIASLDIGHLKNTLRERVSDVTSLLGSHTAQARQMLRKLLVNKIELEPGVEGANAGTASGGLCASSASSVARRFKLACLWWPQRDSNPCFSLERAVTPPVVTRTSETIATAHCQRRPLRP